MPLPNPTYLVQDYYNWNGDQFPTVPILVAAAVGGSKRRIRWDGLDAYDRGRVDGLLWEYNNRKTTPSLEAAIVSAFAANFAWHTADFGGTALGASATGLVPGVDYTWSVVYGGTEFNYSVNGTNGQTFTALVAAMDAAMNGDGLDAVLFEDNIEVRSQTKAAGQIVEIFDGNLFASLTGFLRFKEIRAGVTVIADVFDLNFADYSNNQSYAELLIGHLRTITNTTLRPSRDTNDIYFNHGAAAWYYIHYVSAPVPVT